MDYHKRIKGDVRVVLQHETPKGIRMKYLIQEMINETMKEHGKGGDTIE